MIPIVFSTDHNYVMQTGVCILSLLESATVSKYDIYVLINDDVTEEDKSMLREQVSQFLGHRIGFITVGNVFDKGYVIREISTAAYSRLLIPWLLPDYKIVIYSDVDVIFRIDLGEVFKTDLKGNYFGAIKAVIARYGDKKIIHYLKGLNLDANDYYNSGFLLINSSLQRQAKLKDKYLMQAENQYIYQDQDIINIVCKGRIMPISPRYCVTQYFYQSVGFDSLQCYSFYGSEKDIDDFKQGQNCIIHYNGTKPWDTFIYGWTDWWETYRRSIFYDSDLEIRISYKALNPTYTWRRVAGIIKRKLVQLLKKQ